MSNCKSRLQLPISLTQQAPWVSVMWLQLKRSQITEQEKGRELMKEENGKGCLISGFK